MKQTRILIYTLNFAPDGTSTATIVTKLAHRLKQQQLDVSVITTKPHANFEPESRQAQPLNNYLGGLIARSTYHGIPVWHTAALPKSQRALTRMLSYLFHNFWGLLLGLFAVPKANIVLVISPPLTSGLVGWLLTRIRGGRFVYNVQEIYPDVFLQLGAIRAESRMASVLLAIERFIYRHADALTVIASTFQEKLVREKGVSPEKLHLIPNFADVNEITPGTKDNPLAREYGLTSRFVISYSGNIGMTQDLEILLQAAMELQSIPEIQFLIIGDGVQRAFVEKHLEMNAISNVTLLPYQPQSRVANIYASSDLCFVPLMHTVTNTTMPSKIYTIMASGRAALVAMNADSDLAKMVKTVDCGIVIQPSNVQALVEAICFAFNHRDKIAEWGKNGRQHVETHYSTEIIAGQYQRLFDLLG